MRRVASRSVLFCIALAACSGPEKPRPPAQPAPQQVPSLVARQARLLYSGPKAVQHGVQPGAIDESRVAILHGKVRDRQGAALSDVKIAVHRKGQFGHTATATSGLFDLAVNGGAPLVVTYEKEGYLPAQRQLPIGAGRYAYPDDVVLIRPDAQVTAIDLATQGTIQVARGSVSKDRHGARRATVLFAPGTAARMRLPDGRTQPLANLSIRATEYTVGESGPQAMPATLPPSSAYTYAVELNADEARAAGAKELQFTKPVVVYVDNFLGFPAGTPVPVGYYDKERAVWVPAESGVVLKLLPKGRLDADGDGNAESDQQLAKLGIGAEEQQTLASLYQPGQSLWRMRHSHFSTYDYNLSFRCVPKCEQPGQPPPTPPVNIDPPCPTAGSVIGVENQSLGESFPVAGTPYRLHYQSDRVRGSRVPYTLRIPLSGDTLPPGIQRIDLQVDIGGRQFPYTYTPAVNLKQAFTWDGLDQFRHLLYAPIVRQG